MGGRQSDPETKSRTVEWLTLLPVLDLVIRVVKQAGAASEADTDRDGVLSYAAETHALGAGIAMGLLAFASGDAQLVGGIISAVLYGNRGSQVRDLTLLKDITKEFQYWLFGVVIGAALGMGYRLITGAPLQGIGI